MVRLVKVILCLLAVLLVTQAGFSLQWPVAHDEAPLFYEAFLMRTEGRVPYRDIFDFQMPGSFAAYYVLGRLGGFNDLRIRILDLVILSALFLVTFLAMHRFGKIAAFAAALLFGLITVVFPLFVLQPALGLGIASARTPKPAQARLKSVGTHLVFGAGLYGCALVVSTLGLID